MRACVIGGGPAGLYTSKYLANAGFDVSIFEKSNNILGNYKYASNNPESLKSLIENKNIKLQLNTDHTEVDDGKCDFYVMATGGNPRSLDVKNAHLFRKAMDVIKEHYDSCLEYLGDKVCIVGMGNVSFDLLKYIYGKCKDVTILSHRSVLEAPFDNHVLRDLIEDGRWSIRTNLDNNRSNVNLDDNRSNTALDNKAMDRKSISRINMINDILNKGKKTVKSGQSFVARLIFGANLQKVAQKDGKFEIKYSVGDKIISEVCDTLISNIGFVPNKVEIKTKKPIFSVGWCNKAKGNVNDSRIEAEQCVESILKYIQ